MEKLQQDVKSESRTAKLWINYLSQCQMMRLFIYAERTGDLELHLHCVEKMIPIFHVFWSLTSGLSTNVISKVRGWQNNEKSLKDRLPLLPTNGLSFSTPLCTKRWAPTIIVGLLLCWASMDQQSDVLFCMVTRWTEVVMDYCFPCAFVKHLDALERYVVWYVTLWYIYDGNIFHLRC